jgi:hypothetical protein
VLGAAGSVASDGFAGVVNVARRADQEGSVDGGHDAQSASCSGGVFRVQQYLRYFQLGNVKNKPPG